MATPPSLLLHTCCAPCISHPYEVLSEEYRVTAFYYNPNISPEGEYFSRFDELRRYAEHRGFEVIEGKRDRREWTAAVHPWRYHGERSRRCWACYRYRLEETFRVASTLGYAFVATVLSISPHKDASRINAIGRELAEKYSVVFVEADFKKRDGFKRSVELSRENGFYRQDYCGCIYSKRERDKDSAWFRKVAETRQRLVEQ